MNSESGVAKSYSHFPKKTLNLRRKMKSNYRLLLGYALLAAITVHLCFASTLRFDNHKT